MKYVIPFIILLTPLPSFGKDWESVKIEAESIGVQNERTDNYINFLNQFHSITSCIGVIANSSTHINNTEMVISKLKDNCFDGDTRNEEDYINCLALTHKASSLFESLLDSMSNNLCIISSHDLTQFKKLAEAFKKETQIAKDNYRNHLINNFRLYREKVLSVLKDSSTLFDCEMEISNDYSKLVSLSMKSKVAAYTGNLYKFNNTMTIIQALRDRMVITAKTCSIENNKDIRDANKTYQELISKFKSLDNMTASKRACKLLKKKGFANGQLKNLCDNPVDSPSYRYVISMYLQKSHQGRSQ